MVEPGAGVLELAMQARVTQQAQVGVAVTRVEMQALREPLLGMYAKRAIRAVAGVLFGESAQHHRRAPLPGRLAAEQFD